MTPRRGELTRQREERRAARPKSAEAAAIAAIDRAQQVEAIEAALQTLDVNPELIRWRYIQAAFSANFGNVSATARQLSMHRRTLQRILAAKAPPERCAQHG